jgi:hypothetical protein
MAEIMDKIKRLAEEELIEEGFMRYRKDNTLVWTEKGMIEAFKTKLKFFVGLDLKNETIIIRKD